MAKSQEAPIPQIPRNLRNYGIFEPWAESAPPPWLVGLMVLLVPTESCCILLRYHSHSSLNIANVLGQSHQYIHFNCSQLTYTMENAYWRYKPIRSMSGKISHSSKTSIHRKSHWSAIRYLSRLHTTITPCIVAIFVPVSNF